MSLALPLSYLFGCDHITQVCLLLHPCETWTRVFTFFPTYSATPVYSVQYCRGPVRWAVPRRWQAVASCLIVYLLFDSWLTTRQRFTKTTNCIDVWEPLGPSCTLLGYLFWSAVSVFPFVPVFKPAAHVSQDNCWQLPETSPAPQLPQGTTFWIWGHPNISPKNPKPQPS